MTRRRRRPAAAAAAAAAARAASSATLHHHHFDASSCSLALSLGVQPLYDSDALYCFTAAFALSIPLIPVLTVH